MPPTISGGVWRHVSQMSTICFHPRINPSSFGAQRSSDSTYSIRGTFEGRNYTVIRYEDPNSAASSFSMLLGDSPHLDGQYAIFGKVTKGDETLKALEELPTRREGIFVMVMRCKLLDIPR
ncbi:unnamed protein product [Prunus armeniaca]